MGYPSFNAGDILNASDMNAVGLWKIETKSVTTASEITFDGVFSSTYLNYLVTFAVSACTSTNVIGWQERSSGSNATSSYSYVGAGYYLSAGSGFQNILAGQNIANGAVGSFDGASGSQGHAVFEIHAPATSAYTSVTGRSSMATGNTGMYFVEMGSQHFVSNVYDGFRLFVPSGNFTATATVYGYQK